MGTQLNQRSDRVWLALLALVLTALVATGASVDIHQKKTAYLVADRLFWLFAMGAIAVMYRRLRRKR